MNTPRLTDDGKMAKDQSYKAGLYWLTWMLDDIVHMGVWGGKDDVSVTAFLQREWACAKDVTGEKLAACTMEMKDKDQRVFSLPTGPDEGILRRLVEIREDIEANQQSNSPTNPSGDTQQAAGKWEGNAKYIGRDGTTYTPVRDGKLSLARTLHGGGGKYLNPRR